MPIRTSKRNVGKDKKKVGNDDASVMDSSGTIDGSNLSSQNNSKEWTGDPSDSNTMKSMASRSNSSGSSHSKHVDAESSSLGTVESAKEAKEKDKHRSWVKTIGIRTLRLRKGDKSKSHIPVEEIFTSSEAPVATAATTAGVSDSASTTTTETSATTTTATATSPSAAGERESVAGEHVKLKKSSRFTASTSNGSVLRDKILSSVTSSSSSSGANVGGKTKTKEVAGADAATVNADKQDPARFAGEGMSFKAKLIGVLEVSGPRGDRICQEALSELKMAVKAAGEHKQKITVHIALDGLRIRDEKTGDCLYHHQVHKVSFIAQDLTDARAFGVIHGSPDTGHRFFGIKTEKSANQVVIAMRDLFQVVFDLKKKEIERAKQQLEMQQKFLATRAAETAPKIDHRSSSIAETYIEGACALGTPSSPRTATAPEVDLLNLEVELNSLQDNMDNIHNNLAETVPFRGSTASISSDPMNPVSKFSSGGIHSNNSSQSQGGGTTNSNFVTSSGDPFGDSFDPFDSSIGGGGGTPATFQQKQQQQSQQSFQYSQNSPVAFANADPFTQIDPFPQPKLLKLENSDSFFTSDPFDTPVGNFSFNFGSSSGGGSSSGPPMGDMASGASSGFVSSESTVAPTSMNNHQNSRSCNNSFAGESTDVSGTNWQASFDDNFVPDSLTSNGSFTDNNKVDIFTELDPLGTGRVRPFVDRKDFFQELKNPPKREKFLLKDLYYSSTESGTVGGQLEDSPAQQQQQQQTPQSGSAKMDRADTIPNSFSTNFNPTGLIDSKTSLHRKITERNGRDRSSASSRLYRSSHETAPARSVSPPHYSPPPPPPASSSSTEPYPNSFSNNEYFAATTTSESSTVPPLLLPPPSSSASLTGSGSSPSFNNNSSSSRNATKKSPQLLKQITIASSGITHSSSSPKTLPRSARLGKQFTIDLPSSDEQSPIPNLTPPPRGAFLPKGGSGKTMTLSTAVPRPYSAGSDKSMGLRSSSAMQQHFNNTSNLGPEPPPRPLQTTMINTSGAINMNNSMSLESSNTGGPPLPPKKKGQMSVPLCTPSVAPIVSGKQLYTSESMKKKEISPKVGGGGSSSMDANNDLPLPLPLRKAQIGIHNGQVMSGSGGNAFNLTSGIGNRYSVTPPSNKSSAESSSSKAPDFVVANIPPRPDLVPDKQQQQPRYSEVPTVKSAAILTMEQALHQVASLSLGQLATRLELPVERLANYTVQQLAEKLTAMELDSENHHGNRHHRYSGSCRELNQTTSTTTTTGKSFVGFESNFNSEFDDDFSTVSAPAATFHHHHHHHHQSNKHNSNNHSNRNNNNSASNSNINNTTSTNSYDKYAVFRELTVEDAMGGFSLASGKSSKEDNNKDGSEDEDDQSKTMEQSAMSRDSSSERTLQVDGGGAGYLNTMDDVTDGNLSDTLDDKFPLDDEVSPLTSSVNTGGAKCDWATFESNFEDSFAPLFDGGSGGGRIPLKLQSIQKKPDSPWDSDEDEKLTPIDKVVDDNTDKNIIETTTGDYVLPPHPEEFNFQPFEKPSPIVVGASSSSSEIRRSSRDRPPAVFEAFELEPKSPASFTRQSSGSSKHSMGSDSGRHAQARSRTGSRDYDKSGGGDRWATEVRSSRPDSRNSYTSASGKQERKYRDSDEEFGTMPYKYSAGNSRDNSLRRSGPSRSRRDRDEGDEEEDDDDRSYHSYHSNYSQSRRHHHHHHRRYPQQGSHKPHHHHSSSALHATGGSNPIKKRRGSGSKDISPERYSNQESDYDDSYDEDNGSSNGSMRRGDYYSSSREYYGKPTSNHSQLKYPGNRVVRPNSGSGSSSRYSNYDRDSPRDYYHRDRDHHRGEYREGGKSYRPPPRHGGSPERERYSHGRRMQNYPRSEDDLDDNNVDGAKVVKGSREYSDGYSCEENQVSLRRPGKGRRPASSRVERERERERENRKPRESSGRSQQQQHYYTNSPSWDSESPDGGGVSGGDRRKIRWGSNRAPAGRNSKQSVDHLENPPSKSPSPLTISNNSSRGGSGRHQDQQQRITPRTSISKVDAAAVVVGFEDDFATSDRPRSSFDDNFVVSNNGCQINNMESQLNSIEFKRGEDNDNFGGDVFFPAKFDVDLEIEKESIKTTATASPSLTPSSAEMTRSSPRLESILNSTNSCRLESIRSEEERLQSSDDGADLSPAIDNVKENEDKTCPLEKQQHDSNDNEKEVTSMKKSESFNIFEQEKDPFADDFFAQ